MGLYRELARVSADLEGIDVLHMCEAAGLIVMLWDADGDLIHVSESLSETLNLEPVEGGGGAQLHWHDESGWKVDGVRHPAATVRRTAADAAQVRLQVSSDSGQEAWLQMSFSPLARTPSGWSVLGVGVDISASTRAMSELRQLATHDGLTGLANRAGVRDFVLERIVRREAAMAAARRSGQEDAAVLLLDIDHFKRVNDEHGHFTGDNTLRVIADRLRAGTPPGGCSGRWGGEELLLVLPDTGVEEAAAVAEAIRVSIGETSIEVPDGEAITVTVSIGVAAGPCALPGDFERLVNLADDAMYDAKRSGRNRVAVAEPSDTPALIPTSPRSRFGARAS